MNPSSGSINILANNSAHEIHYSGISNVGKKREINEDSLLIVPEKAVFGVADGVGGMHAGDIASKMLTDGIRRQLGHQSTFPSKLFRFFMRRKKISLSLEQMAINENARIFQKSKALKRPMASTLVAVRFFGLDVEMVHVGDSRAYMWRNKKLAQITNDHSLVNELYMQGHIKYDEMKNHPRKNVITRAIGSSEDVQPGVSTVTVRANDMFLLCSDGLTSMLSDIEIKNILLSTQVSPADIAKKLVDCSNDAGGNDNITVLIIKIDNK